MLLIASPAMAHHAMGGRTPSNLFESFLAGLAHPLIGPDHFAFVVAVGLLAAIKRQGILIVIGLILSVLLGTELHILGLSLPGAELFVSGSILLFGILLTIKDSPSTFMIVGIFHGYAYGEPIFGVEKTPLLTYLLGFTTSWMVVSACTFAVTKARLQRDLRQKMPTNCNQQV